ncbi:isochorismatase family protein [Methylocella sp. CPCC 101449]|jgi:nicotinamidase-related amidase|uniref:isochorismatase family protein n=1 Tax=Methylocella sp. CPCC 101449 TaxID=2987531 RepID=UPI00288F1DB2|nr:isochorismatase family protein [Methylocella sp. CPCC 101449]MDT2021317.1 isochorismatase family protein [Methylocella sp. CPCC 101449]HEV2571409.1 isochorismatase family protein [Beijerinckiaceae bacterium]
MNDGKTTERIWDKFLTDRDKAVFKASGFGAKGGYGKRPALLVIDVSWAFAGDKPEPILDSIKRWSTSCGAESWDAIAKIKVLAETFRARKLPVIYTTGVARDDGWDMGSWSWKNPRMNEAFDRPQVLDGNEIVSEIAPQPQDLMVLKQKPSGFFGTNLSAYLTLLGADSVIVTGTTTSGCVRATVIDAFSLNYRVAVAEDACFDRAQASHAINLCDMHAKYADVLPTADIIAHIKTLPDGLFPNLPKGVPAHAPVSGTPDLRLVSSA